MGMESWLGNCHLVRGWEDSQESYNVQVAVFCDGRDGFEKLLRTHIHPQGYRLLWAEEVLSATGWGSASMAMMEPQPALPGPCIPSTVLSLGP